MAKSTQPKNATITRVNQVFKDKEDTMVENLTALFELLSRKEFQFGTPGERARFEAAKQAFAQADVSVENAEVKILADAAVAQEIANALAVPNADGELETPSVESVLNAEELPNIIRRYVAHSAMVQGMLNDSEARAEENSRTIEELTTRAEAVRLTAADLLEENQALQARNEQLEEDNRDLYNQANYVTSRGKVYPVKKTNRVVVVVASILMAGCVLLTALSTHLGIKNKQAAQAYNDLSNDYKVVYNLTQEQQAEIQKLIGDNVLLEGEVATLENLNAALESENAGLEKDITGLEAEVGSLKTEIAGYKDRYEKVVDLAQNAGFAVADDVKMEDLFNTIMASTEKEGNEDAQAVYTTVLNLMFEHGVKPDDLKDENGNYTSSKINPELVEIFDAAIANAKTVADIESVIDSGLEGTGKTRADFEDHAEALEFIKEQDEKAIAELENTVAEKEKAIAEKEAEITSLEKTVEDLNKVIENLENQPSVDNSAVIADLEAKVAQQESTISSLNNTLNSVRKELSNVKAERDAALSNVAVLERAYSSIVSAYDTALENNEALEAENEALRNENAGLKEENAGLKEDLKNQGSSSTQTPADQPSTDNESGNVNVGDVNPEDENVNPGQGDKDKVNSNEGELGDE